jgi:hypothetical protein
MGAKDVPSYDAYLKASKQVMGGSKLQEYTGSLGNLFYTSSIPAAISKVCDHNFNYK